MNNQFCSLFLVFCLVFATIIQSWYGLLVNLIEANEVKLETFNLLGDPTNEDFPLESEHEEEALQVVDILETEPHINYPVKLVNHNVFNCRNNLFGFLDKCITWQSDNTSPPPEV